jgi:tetrahydromethanopterin S-methyltransferase subunit B
MICKGKTYIKGVCKKCKHFITDCDPIRIPSNVERIAKLESDMAMERVFAETNSKRIVKLEGFVDDYNNSEDSQKWRDEIDELEAKVNKLEEEHKALIRLLPTRVREIMGVPTKNLSSEKIHAIANDHAKRGRPKKGHTSVTKEHTSERASLRRGK